MKRFIFYLCAFAAFVFLAKELDLNNSLVILLSFSDFLFVLIKRKLMLGYLNSDSQIFIWFLNCFFIFSLIAYHIVFSFQNILYQVVISIFISGLNLITTFLYYSKKNKRKGQKSLVLLLKTVLALNLSRNVGNYF